MSIVLETADSELKREVCLFTAVHEPRETSVTLDMESSSELIDAIQVDDRVILYAVSAPYPGYQCIVEAGAALTLAVCPTNWDRRKYALLFLHHSGFQSLMGQNDTRLHPLYEANVHAFPATCKVFSNMDICRFIITFL